MKRRHIIPALLAVVALSLSGCSSSTHEKTADDTQAKPVQLTVFAAASLNKAFPEIVDKVLKKDHPEITVTFSFEGSKTLVEQLESGAPADVFASADEKNMNKANDKGLVTDIQPFAGNVLALITPKGNPAKITGLDNSLDGKKLVVCAPGVPCGNATEQLAKNLYVELKPVSEEQKVTDVRGKVENGEADAGLVYITDAKAAGDKVDIIDVPGTEKVVNNYPIALVKGSKNADAAKAFIGAILSPEGQKILARYGFRAPAK